MTDFRVSCVVEQTFFASSGNTEFSKTGKLKMTIPNSLNAENLRRDGVPPASYSDYIHANAHVVSWASILVGATTIAALSLILLMLGAGLGLSSVSPWSHSGISSSSFGISTIIWIVVTQLLAAGMGGYLAGRLRTKWTGVHTDEVYFRDTAHGFMAWAVATLATAALLTSVYATLWLFISFLMGAFSASLAATWGGRSRDA
jgi:predicted permease